MGQYLVLFVQVSTNSSKSSHNLYNKSMKKIIKNPTIISLIVLIAVFLFSRLYNLTLLPIFTDESIYIYWAKVIESSHDQYFISLTDGKPPLLIWMISVFLTILPDSWYLVAGRLPAVIAGLVVLSLSIALPTSCFTIRK